MKFKIVTDCDSVRLTMNKKDVVPRILRWVMYLENFDYTLEHRSNKRMVHVDALSRAHDILIIAENTFEQVLGLKQDSHAQIKEIKDNLLLTESPLYELRNGIVYRKENGSLLFYVPEKMVLNVIQTSHEKLGHLGTEKVMDYVKQTYWFPKMRQQIKPYIENCLKCIVYSPKHGVKEGFLHNIDKGKVPFDTLHVDHLGPLEKSKEYHRHILVVIDAFTKFVKIFPCKSTSSQETIKHLRNYFTMYSRPRRIIADRGTCFSSVEFQRFVESFDVQLTLVATNVPRANGQCEVVNRSLAPMLAKLCDSTNTWDRVLHEAEFAFNNSINSTTKEIPSKLLFGIVQKGAVSDRVREILNSLQEEERNIEELREKADENIKKQQKYSKENYDQKHKEAKTYEVGDYVVIKNIDNTPNVNKKLLPKYKGPYVVTTVLPNDRYIVEDVPDFQLTQIPYKGTVDADHMKLWSKSN